MKEMIQYTGTKTVKACPMTLGEAEKYLNRHIDSTAVENREETPGYLVDYGEDGDGYQSWSPKEVFEKAYRKSENYIDRMKIEHDEMKQRYLKGRDFSFSRQFRELPENERELIMNQLLEMEGIIYILSRRIELAEKRESSSAPEDTSSAE